MQTLQENTTLQSGKYRIIKVLGQGGFGITYLAEQVMQGRKVAIKEFFYKECCDREEGASHVTLGTQSNRETVQRFMKKFLKEARTISQLDHPNIIKIYDIFEENYTAYYVMEYIEGENLSEMVKRQGALPEATAVAYIRKVADALAYIHARSINHLDVKPGNIMYNRSDNQIILIDFGQSKQYDDVGSQTSSTPVGISQGFAPIEQYRAGGVAQFTPQTDIYSLGATLYWLIIGKTPPPADEILDDGLPSMPSYVSASVKKAIESAMQVKKKDRPQRVEVFQEMLWTNKKEDSVASRLIERNHLPDETTQVIKTTFTKRNTDGARDLGTSISPQQLIGTSLGVTSILLLIVMVASYKEYNIYLISGMAIPSVLFSICLRCYMSMNDEWVVHMVRVLFSLVISVLFAIYSSISVGVLTFVISLSLSFMVRTTLKKAHYNEGWNGERSVIMSITGCCYLIIWILGVIHDLDRQVEWWICFAVMIVSVITIRLSKKIHLFIWIAAVGSFYSALVYAWWLGVIAAVVYIGVYWSIKLSRRIRN